MGKHPQVLTWAGEYKELCGMDPPTNPPGRSRMPVAEALASTMRPTLPPIPPKSATTTSVDRVEDRSDSSSTGSSGTYFSSLRSSYNKLRISTAEPVAPGLAAPSLPSLKSSGLLESWASQPQPPSQQLPDAGTSDRPTSPTPPWMALRATGPKESAAGPSEATASPSALSRSSKSTMPVGLDWLANEL
jgi:hypothetical protein